MLAQCGFRRGYCSSGEDYGVVEINTDFETIPPLRLHFTGTEQCRPGARKEAAAKGLDYKTGIFR